MDNWRLENGDRVKNCGFAGELKDFWKSKIEPIFRNTRDGIGQKAHEPPNASTYAPFLGGLTFVVWEDNKRNSAEPKAR